jgi:hypothetical protein
MDPWVRELVMLSALAALGCGLAAVQGFSVRRSLWRRQCSYDYRGDTTFAVKSSGAEVLVAICALPDLCLGIGSGRPAYAAMTRERRKIRDDDIATSTGLYSGCAHATDGKPARHAQSSYATHPWVATPIAPISADTTIIAAPTCCQRVSVSAKYLTSIGLPSQ